MINHMKPYENTELYKHADSDPDVELYICNSRPSKWHCKFPVSFPMFPKRGPPGMLRRDQEKNRRQVEAQRLCRGPVQLDQVRSQEVEQTVLDVWFCRNEHGFCETYE